MVSAAQYKAIWAVPKQSLAAFRAILNSLKSPIGMLGSAPKRFVELSTLGMSPTGSSGALQQQVGERSGCRTSATIWRRIILLPTSCKILLVLNVHIALAQFATGIPQGYATLVDLKSVFC